jgi:hypothetical protein
MAGQVPGERREKLRVVGQLFGATPSRRDCGLDVQTPSGETELLRNCDSGFEKPIVSSFNWPDCRSSVDDRHDLNPGRSQWLCP